MEQSRLGEERLHRFLARAAAGEELTVGFFGGSITQGCLASRDELCYARRFFDLLSARFPEARLHYVNGSIGGTGSHFGAMRLWNDLLMYRPDLVIVDFSVNDAEAVLPLYEDNDGKARGGTDWHRGAEDAPAASGSDGAMKIYPETFEAVLRGILRAGTSPAVIVLNNVFYDTGVSTEEEHNAVASHYGVPHVSVRDTILPRIKNGEFTREDLSADGLHPNDRGHELIAEELMKLVGSIAEQAENDPEDEATGDLLRLDGASAADLHGELPAPLTDNTYEGIGYFTIANCVPELEGFRADSEEKKGHLDCFRNGWIGCREGDRLRITLSGADLAVVYRKTIRRPSPVAELVLDGDLAHPVTLDGNFDQDWGDCLFLQPILHHGRDGKHSIEITIVRATPQDRAPFYLLAFGASSAG
ncbi:MAG: SGNH/GDSL hydrolase family protein [Lachnospiraceae bacterium]|nr:SGNH/GDSL hydrolase family protein [Lachnospiraceae bacterium]